MMMIRVCCIRLQLSWGEVSCGMSGVLLRPFQCKWPLTCLQFLKKLPLVRIILRSRWRTDGLITRSSSMWQNSFLLSQKGKWRKRGVSSHTQRCQISRQVSMPAPFPFYIPHGRIYQHQATNSGGLLDLYLGLPLTEVTQRARSTLWHVTCLYSWSWCWKTRKVLDVESISWSNHQFDITMILCRYYLWQTSSRTLPWPMEEVMTERLACESHIHCAMDDAGPSLLSLRTFQSLLSGLWLGTCCPINLD